MRTPQSAFLGFCVVLVVTILLACSPAEESETASEKADISMISDPEFAHDLMMRFDFECSQPDDYTDNRILGPACECAYERFGKDGKLDDIVPDDLSIDVIQPYLAACKRELMEPGHPYPAEVRAEMKKMCVLSVQPYRADSDGLCKCIVDQFERRIALADIAVENFSEEGLMPHIQECASQKFRLGQQEKGP